MDLSSETGHSDASDDKMVGFCQGKDMGLYEEDKQVVEFEEGSPAQENILQMAFSNQLSAISP
jgi:hypothetical protein